MTFWTRLSKFSVFSLANDRFDAFLRIHKVQEVLNYMININKHVYDELITK